MISQDEVINKVSQSNIETLDLSLFYPLENDLVGLDFKQYLFMELILKEKDFREQLKQENFSAYKDKFVFLFCSADAIIPKWAFMLLTSYLHAYTNNIFFGERFNAREHFFTQIFLNTCLTQSFLDKRVVLKGCGEVAVSENAFVYATNQLMPFVKSIMYGEPCSTVPIFKRK